MFVRRIRLVMKTVVAGVFILLGQLGAGVAYADSDGYYCVGRGYLAYQFGLAPPPMRPHRLFIIRLEAPGLEPPSVFELPQFQVHGMRCDDRTIQLAAHDTVYEVTLDAAGRPVRYESSPWPGRGRVPPQFVGQPRNLGIFNPAVTALKPLQITLGAAPEGGQYVLELTATTTSTERCAPVVTASRVVRTDRGGRELGQFEIFRGRGSRECGD